MNEIIFVVEEAAEGGYIAKALGESIVTQSETTEELKEMIKDAVRCHFDVNKLPKMIRLHFVKEEVFAVWKYPAIISGDELAKRLKRYGYLPTRQSGSHIRLTSNLNGEHHITIPNHSPIKIGTLSAIVLEVANYLGKTKDEVMRELME